MFRKKVSDMLYIFLMTTNSEKMCLEEKMFSSISSRKRYQYYEHLKLYSIKIWKPKLLSWLSEIYGTKTYTTELLSKSIGIHLRYSSFLSYCKVSLVHRKLSSTLEITTSSYILFSLLLSLNRTNPTQSS